MQILSDLGILYFGWLLIADLPRRGIDPPIKQAAARPRGATGQPPRTVRGPSCPVLVPCPVPSLSPVLSRPCPLSCQIGPKNFGKHFVLQIGHKKNRQAFCPHTGRKGRPSPSLPPGSIKKRVSNANCPRSATQPLVQQYAKRYTYIWLIGRTQHTRAHPGRGGGGGGGVGKN